MKYSFRKNTLYESLIFNILKLFQYVYDHQISQLLFYLLGHKLGKNSTNSRLYDILGTLVKCSRVCRQSAYSKQQVMTYFGGTLNCPRPNRECTNSE